MTNDTRGMWYGLAGVTAFALTLPATRVVIPYLHPLFIGFGRALVAAAVAALILLWHRQRPPARGQWRLLAVAAAGVVVGFPVCSAWAMQHVPAAHGGVVLGVLPLATAAASLWFSGERPSRGFWAVGVVGAALVVGFALQEGGGAPVWADLALLLAVIAAAIGYAAGGQLAKSLGGWQVICWALVVAAPLLALPALAFAPAAPDRLPASAWLAFAYLALVSQLFGFFFWNKGLALGGVARVSQTQLLQPFITLLAAALLLGETVDATTLWFALLVVASVALGRRMPVRQRRSANAQAGAAGQIDNT